MSESDSNAPVGLDAEPRLPKAHPLWNKSTAAIVVVLLICIAAYSIFGDVAALRGVLASFHWIAFVYALALSALNYAIRYVRWCWYLRGSKVSVPHKLNVEIFLSGFAFSITPGKVGELVKSVLLSRLRGINVARTAPIVIAERITDLLALLCLGLIGIALYGVAVPMVLAGLAVMTIGMLVLAMPTKTIALIELCTKPKSLRRFRTKLNEIYANLRTLMTPKQLFIAVALGIAAWLAECLGFALITNAFPGAAVPLGLAILIYAATTIAGALSFLPGGLLVTETAMTVWLVESSSGLQETSAIAATVLTRLATLWFAVVIGLVTFMTLRRHKAPER